MGKQQFEDDDDFDEFDDADDAQDQNGPAALRKALNKYKRELKAARAELGTFRSQSRESALAEVFAANGIPDKAKSFVPSDVTTKADIEKWAADYGDVFGAKPPAGDADTKDTQVDTTAEVDEAKRVAALSHQATSPASIEALEARMQAATTPDEVAAIMKDAAAAGLPLS